VYDPDSSRTPSLGLLLGSPPDRPTAGRSQSISSCGANFSGSPSNSGNDGDEVEQNRMMWMLRQQQLLGNPSSDVRLTEKQMFELKHGRYADLEQAKKDVLSEYAILTIHHLFL
jgi:hypothetical protein